MSVIEALHIFDEHNTPLLEHTYTGRPPPASILLPLFLSQPDPRPSLIYLPNTNPPTLLYSIIQDQLLFLAPCSKDTEPLQVLEFLHRVADVLEDFLGSPLLASKIEGNYDVVAQLLNEMVDGGVISCTEPNALKDVVETPSFMKSLLGGVGLPSSAPSSLTPSATPFSLTSRPSLGRPTSNPANNAPSVPWRRANVRHTSNEMYVDIVETLQVTIAPSGRPLSAIANGTIAFTAKVSGVPDLLLLLGSPGGILNTVSLPVFHPCVRLNRWKERPGELSFVPPDGRFVLAGYEVDLLGSRALDSFSTASKAGSAPKLKIPATASIATSMGPSGTDFEVRLTINPRYAGRQSSTPSSATGSSFPRGSAIGRGLGGTSFGGTASAGTTAAPSIEEVVVHIPLPAGVKNVTDLRIVRGAGDAGYAPGDRSIEWRISQREVNSLMSTDRGSGMGATATLRGTVVGVDEEDASEGGPVGITSNPYEYDDDEEGANASSSYQTPSDPVLSKNNSLEDSDARRIKLNKVLMPSCVTVSFSVKGWLPSGIKVESLAIDSKRSKGLGAGVTPYKGVKYLCVSRKGVESRC
ncbi:hypothetical protein BU24DRAFT_469155 [Aaosphaeria arxii CBS 175.79]|uniref:MHD domain-containing protein n=1 Tax=Aaosphaeria arxii CBS 175.79 TaxID=1450172 RepID=A0A6A5Y581_9PLEO|nr:uncharacterized protein BU24DRAFT_469155 [Aaosphaeria arxii CBS 175.79]KAF2020373.1 hypothetical protein BU24DRAFT_469155 [Aaosphaeria arxii CBS 175.79]